MATASAPHLLRLSPIQLEHELDLLEGAITLVASAGASRVIVLMGGGNGIPRTARSRARSRGVTLRAKRRADGYREIVVEPA